MHFHTNNRIAAGSHARAPPARTREHTHKHTFGNSGNVLLCIDIAVCAEDAVLIRCSSMLPEPGGMRSVKKSSLGGGDPQHASAASNFVRLAFPKRNASNPDGC